MSRIAALASFVLLLSQANATVDKRDSSTTSMGNVMILGNSCPNGWSEYTHNSDTHCCPGAVYNTDDDTSNEDSAYCCVGAHFSAATPSFSSCFPFCTGTESGNGVTVMSTTKQSCSATVMLTDSDYSSKVSAAATSTGGGSGAMTTGGSSTGSQSGSAAAQTGSSSSSAGAAIMTSGPLAGALMVAGGMLFV